MTELDELRRAASRLLSDQPAEPIEPPHDRWAGWSIPAGYVPNTFALCRGCRRQILWMTTPNGRPSPHDANGESHFASCPQAERFRRR